MYTTWQKWNQISLLLRIACGIVLGIVFAMVFPKVGLFPLFGTLFVSALKAVAPILVFFLVLSSIANAQKSVGPIRAVISLYLLSTLLASFISVMVSFIFPVSIHLTQAVGNMSSPAGVVEVLKTLLMNVVSNPIAALASANYLGILAWGIVIGIAVRYASQTTKDVVSDFSYAITTAVKWIISFAPFGIMGLVYEAVSDNGMNIFIDYGKLLLLLVGCMLFIALVVNPLIAFSMLHRNPYPLVFKCLKESGLTAFFTRSSAANIPINMNLCERLGLNKDLYSVSISLGATINMSGAAVTISVMTLAAVHTLGIPIDIPTALILSVLASLSACGASGVAGGSLLLIPMACSLFGISNDIAMQVVGVGFIIGVVQDSFETAINSSSDVLFAAVAEYRDWIREGKQLPL